MKENIEHGRSGKHCHNCKYLHYEFGDIGDPEGWVCDNRDYQTCDEQNKHLAQLGTEAYRFKGKKCFVS